MILGESTDRWFWSEDVDVAVDFCVRALRHDGLRVPPFDRHPDGDGSRRALGLDPGGWRRWLDAVLVARDRLDPVQWIGPHRSRSAGEREQVPGFGDPLERMHAAVLKTESRSGHEVLDGARDEYVTRASERRDAGADRDRDPDDLAVADFALAGVETGPHLETDRSQRIAEGSGGENRPGGPIEPPQRPSDDPRVPYTSPS